MTADGAYWMLASFAGILGLLFGSFLNVCVARMPEDRSVVFPGSACPRCGAAIQPYDNVPVLAWLWLGGKCRACKGPISPLYPIVEALSGVLAVLLFRRVIPDLGDFDTPHLVAMVWYGWLLFALLGASFIDLRHYIIPDEFSVYSIPVAVGGAALLGQVGYHHGVTWQASVVGAAAGALGLGALTGIYWLIRREEGMGMGDVKLLALFGAYFGAVSLLGILLIASVVGSIVGVPLALLRRSSLRMALPFGPFLALGAGVWLFAGPELEPAITIRLATLFDAFG
jgi:leader peptidase (prepilin peptidase)/N-methyltransferase